MYRHNPQRTHAPDEDLVLAAQRGDEAAFAALATRYSARVERILRRVTADDAAAEDALQETLLRAWNKIGSFQGRSGFFTWLTRIAINEGLRARPTGHSQRTIPLEDAVGQRIPDWGARPDEIFEAREFLDALDQALRRLPDDYRVAVVLRDIEGLTTAEAAALLSIEAGALKSRLHRGRMALRRELDAYFNER